MNEFSSTPIAEGRTAEIYAWDDEHVLKLFRDWCPSHWVDYEARIARTVYEAGVPAPAAGEILEVNGRRGMLYERLEGPSMLEEMNAHPWTLFKHARALAELQIQINRQSVTGLPSYKDRLRNNIRETRQLGADLREKVLTMLAALPDGQSLCHGDLHPGNVILTKRGPVAIDWMNACTGVPGADLARTDLLINVGAKAAGKQISAVMRMAVRLYSRVYQSRYLELSPGARNEMERWMPLIVAARLDDDIAPEREILLDIVKRAVG